MRFSVAISNDFQRNLKKYIDYFFETKGFTAPTHPGEISGHAVQAARSIRGAERGPAIIIHGIMPRAGTNYVGELLRRHPDLYAFPYQLWEFPALWLTKDVLSLQEKFLQGYKLNRGKLGEADFLPLFGASLMAYLHGPVPPQQRVLTKMPSVQYLDYFFLMFPHENLMVLVRDGRDLVHSTLRTWPRLNFLQVCLRWNRSARMVLSTLEHLKSTGCQEYWLARYEDALQDPVNFVREACGHFGLDENRYLYEQIDEIKVIGSSKLDKQHKKKLVWRHLDKPKGFKPTEYWQQWSSIRKLIFKTVAGQSLLDLGYCKDLNW